MLEGKQDAEKQFHFVAENPGEMVCVLDRQGRFLYSSPSHAKHFDSAVLGSGSLWFGVIHTDDHGRASEFLEKVATTQARRRARLRLVPSDGPPRYVEILGSPVKDHRGDISGIVVVTQRLDVSAVGTERG